MKLSVRFYTENFYIHFIVKKKWYGPHFYKEPAHYLFHIGPVSIIINRRKKRNEYYETLPQQRKEHYETISRN